ncbi:MAG: type II toxin-antitoxin system HipA family toxin [Lachnospiraceae bacterium]|nr:type II toxin-antitoxin system HipA family toxin [Lachnospiraceae bacterium]
MGDLCVYIEIDGSRTRVGKISGNRPENAVFRYEPAYLNAYGSKAVSISLPLQSEEFSPLRTKMFFEGLLPEGFTRRSVAQWLRADENDYLTILAGLGKECLGAIQILAEGDTPPEPAYRKLTEKEVRDFAAEGAAASAELVTKAHLSLTGASGKAGLYLDTKEGSWYLPEGTAPSTHIVKQSHVRLKDIVVNEQLCQLTAKHLGIRVPDSFIAEPQAGESLPMLFATGRYDRKMPDCPAVLSGHPVPLRLHQEDFAQALGVPAAEKYESPGRHYLHDMFTLLRMYSADPVSDQLRLWDMIIFDHLVGNADNHIKNFSLLYNESLSGIRLAPAYDMVSTAVYESQTRNMAMNIGGQYDLSSIGRASFAAAAAEAGIGSRMALQRFDRMAEAFVPALEKAADELEKTGISRAAELKDEILRFGGIADLI